MVRQMPKLKAVDFFCGAGGMTNGFQKAGVRVIAGIDIANDCKSTYEFNNPHSKFILADIKKLRADSLETAIDIQKRDDTLIFIGCSPCQYWTKILTTKEKSAESKNLLMDFKKFIDYYLPGFIVIENVPGILSTKNSPLDVFLRFLKKNGYVFRHGIINASHFGVPQTRKRFLLIASRVTTEIQFPERKNDTIPTVRDFIGSNKNFPVLNAGHIDNATTLHTTAGLSPKNLQRLQATPHNGGTRLAYVNKKNLAIPSQYKNKRVFVDTYGRMSWDKPAPTITTKFISLSNGRFGHPDQDRALSLREGATLQTFEQTYQFFGNSLGSLARQIGNAVPPVLAQHIASIIIKSWQK
jgi:DNA (cytosine-5)-methyltransferase 1